MLKRLTATILAGAIALTAIPASPARAGDEDLAKLLVGTTALIIIGTALAKNGKKDDDDDGKRVYHAPEKVQTHQNRVQVHRIEPPGHGYRDQHVSRGLPRYCLRRLDTREGPIRVFGAHCLHRNYDHANRLPQSCKREIRTHNGPRRGYSAYCLRQNGYHLAGR